MWTKRQLQNAMRAAGYARVDGPGSSYEHTRTGYIVELDHYDAKRYAPHRFQWQQWAAVEQTPPPF
jgi:hypothetical protein